MHKKLLAVLTIFFLFPIISSAQIDLCGTPDDPLTQKTKDLIYQSKMMQVEFCVNIRFHILQNSSGVNAVPDSHINLILNDLNLAFNQYQIFFNSVGINHIQNDTYYDIDDIGDDEGVTEFNGLINLNDNDSNAINLYIVNDAESFGGRAQRPGNSTVIASSAVLATTNVHEVGHNFGLLHTHSTASGTENITRDPNNINYNCEDEGDGFCSTPADPNLLNQIVDPPVYKVDTGCNYTAAETRNGLPYDPDTSNFMSYSRRYCRNSFTQEQGDFMNVMIQTNSVLQQTVSSSCAIPELVGAELICNGSNYTYTLQNPPFSFNWTTSNNLQTVTSNSNSITVKAKYNSSIGAGFITANYNNGAEETFEVYINKPDISVTLDSSAPDTEAYAIVIGASTLTENQQLNQYPYYTVVSSSGYSNVYIYEGLDDGYIVKGIGSTNTWSKTIDFYISNNCGTTVERITLTPPPPSGGCDYTLQSTNVNTYSLLPPPDCLSSFQTTTSTESSVMMSSEVVTPNIYSIKVYDMNGVLLLETDEQTINLDSLKKGFYIIKANWNGNETTKKVAKK